MTTGQQSTNLRAQSLPHFSFPDPTRQPRNERPANITKLSCSHNLRWPLALRKIVVNLDALQPLNTSSCSRIRQSTTLIIQLHNCRCRYRRPCGRRLPSTCSRKLCCWWVGTPRPGATSTCRWPSRTRHVCALWRCRGGLGVLRRRPRGERLALGVDCDCQLT
jgi:hypothetical protein